MLRLSDFDYNLPAELIAQYPLEKRDLAKLMVLNRKEATITHSIFKDIPGYFRSGDLLVLNDTKVLPSRLKGSRLTGGKVEVLLLRHKNNSTFQALIKPARIKVHERIVFNGGDLSAEITAKNEITFAVKDSASVYKHGRMPLPPYIKRPPEDLDNTYYQTVYARNEGAIASPTAGLHFTWELISRIRSNRINIANITLHINYPTFKPVKEENIEDYRMEGEYFNIEDQAAGLIKETRLSQSRIIAVGTTSCRALETYACGVRQGYTDLFIYPGYKFKMVDCLLTNFHLPRTTLFMLVCAFAGRDFAHRAYQQAIDHRYRFYSYGDAMLII
ncbi:tRNA preQ1(34) S-adenosylmethionine ribosyltransferase-isomerase QueA [bacterium]|nr:MAG: tRNA preQ1(34) S-adenosylmethionine ribosyltransferase-isomerase QueA [bacterium]